MPRLCVPEATCARGVLKGILGEHHHKQLYAEGGTHAWGHSFMPGTLPPFIYSPSLP